MFKSGWVLIKMVVEGYVIYIRCFSCEYCKIFKNIYFKEHLRTAASWELFMRVLSKEKLSKFIKETVGYFLMFLFQNAFDPLWNKSWIYTNFLTFCTNLKKLIIFIDWVH